MNPIFFSCFLVAGGYSGGRGCGSGAQGSGDDEDSRQSSRKNSSVKPNRAVDDQRIPSYIIIIIFWLKKPKNEAPNFYPITITN